MSKVKICGLKRPDDIEYVNRVRPNFIGFVFAPSKRQVTVEQAASLKALLDPAIKAVGVFVNSPVEQVAAIAEAGIIDMIQLHGDEDAAYALGLRELTKAPIIKAVRVKDVESILAVAAYPCDYYLFDTYTPGQYGGSGKRFDLSILAGVETKRPYFVAGGLDPVNVGQVVDKEWPFAVDVSGGVETDGVKDFAKIQAFVAKVRERSL